MTMKRICMIVYSYYPWDPRVRKEAEALTRNGYDVDVIALRNDEEKEFETIKNVNIYRLNQKTKRGSQLRFLYQYSKFFCMSFFKLNHLDLSKKYDVIHIHSLPDYLVFVAFIQKLKGKKIILDLHESFPEIFLSRFNNKLTAKLLEFIERISANYAHSIITVSNTLKNMFVKRGIKKNITVLFNVPDQKISELKMKRPTSLKNKFILNYSGSLKKERGLDIAIKAINEVKEIIPNIYLMIFGSDDEENNLKKLVKNLKLKNCVYFGGKVTSQKVMEYNNISDIGIIPWYSNPITEVGTPNKLFECIALEKPIIASETKALKDLMGNSILFFKPGDYKEMSNQISFAYNNKNKTKAMTKKAKMIYNKINWDVMEKRLFTLYENI